MATQSQPTIVICSGSFHKPEHYQPLASILEGRGFEVKCPILPTNAVSGVSADDISNPEFDAPPPTQGWPDGYSDAEVVRREIEKLADQGKKILLVGHSYGGWLATESAIPELQHQARTKEGKEGGVVGIFYVSGYILPKGQSIDSFFSPQGDATPPPPFVMLHAPAKQGLVTPIQAEEYFFHDLPKQEARRWASELRAQPVIKSVLTHPSYVDLPCGYLLCKNDKVFPLAVQEMMIKTASDQGSHVKTYDCESGHASFLSWKDGLAGLLEDFSSNM
ncbi:MAG: hypothetical protein Q9187_004439 [Circinaria calcarea]